MKRIMLISLFLFVQTIFSQELNYEILNTSINSDYAEFGITYLNKNTVIFVSSKKNENDVNFIKNRRRHNRQRYLDLYLGTITKTGDIIQTGKFVDEINNKFYQSDISFTPDRKTIYFTWNNFYSTRKRTDSDRWKTLHIVKATINENRVISNITPLPFNSKKYSVSNPEVSKDGKQLFFVSDMNDKKGETDIYVVDIHRDGTYSKPRNLGPNINSEHSEMFPFVDNNNTLYFSSYGTENGLGNLDIFKSEYKNGSYQKPKLLPAPINSSYDDFAFVIDLNTNTGYFTSNRKGGVGDVDIFAFKPENAEEPCVQIIAGMIEDNNGRPINNVQLSVQKNDDPSDVLKMIIDSNFNLELDCDSSYKIIAYKEQYASAEITITIDKSKSNDIRKTLILNHLTCTQFVMAKVLNNETSAALRNVSLALHLNGTVVDTDTTDNSGRFNFVLECDQLYQIIASKPNFANLEIEFRTDKKDVSEIDKTLYLIPLKCSQLITGILIHSETGISLNKATISLFKNNDLLKTVESNNSEFKFELTCNSGYKIIAKKEGYLNAELEIKTKSIHNKLIFKELEMKPIKCIQSISGVIVNKDTNQPLENVKIALYQNGRLKDSLSSTSNTFEFNLDCDQNYSIIAEKEYFVSSEMVFQTDHTFDKNIVETLSLAPKDCVQKITGTIVDKDTYQPLENVKIALYQNDRLKASLSGTSNTFEFDLDCDQNYSIVAEKEYFVSNELAFQTDHTFDKNIVQTLSLTPVDCVQTITGKIVDKNTDQPLENVKIALYQNGRLKASLSGISNTFEFDLNCDQNYSIIAEKEYFVSSEITFQTDHTFDKNIVETMSLTPIDCIQTITGKIVDKDTNRPLENVKISLFQNNLLKEHITSTDGAYNFNLECNKNYRLVAEKEHFTSNEVNVQTNNTYNGNISKTVQLDKLPCRQSIEVTLLNRNTERQLETVQLTLFKNKARVREMTSTGAGFKLELDCNTNYRLVAEKEHFVNGEITFSTNDSYNTQLTKQIILIPVKCTQTLTGRITYKGTGQPLPNALVYIYSDDDTFEILELNNNATFAYKMLCNRVYRVQAVLKDYKNNTVIVRSTGTYDKNISENIEMESIVEFVFKNGERVIHGQPINFDLNKSVILAETALELNKIVVILKKYPDIKIRVEAHTDSRAPDNYSLDLSNDRALATVNYIISLGIDPDRVSGIGYGETRLLNKCSNGVKCSEAEHQQNRRIEFIVE